MRCGVSFFLGVSLVLGVEGFWRARVGEVCVIGNGTKGSCRHLQDCDAAINLIIHQIEPVICGFANGEPLFCCEEGYGFVPRERRSKIKCEEFGNNWHEFDAKSIIGGSKASPREFKHMAALGYGPFYNKKWYCGGSLISETFILTAAHCLYSRIHGTVRWIRLGDLDLESNLDDALPQEFSIRRIIYHPHYHPPSTYNDIALIEINGFVKINEYICPACLHHEEDAIADTIYATGWGVVNTRGDWGKHLQAVPLPLADIDNCMRIYTRSRRLMHGLADTQICVGGGGDIRDTCKGDSGGPLQFESFNGNGKKKYVIFALTSFGKKCGTIGSPSVYTRVAPYVDWIESIVWPN